jgi:hypothetical protein
LIPDKPPTIITTKTATAEKMISLPDLPKGEPSGIDQTVLQGTTMMDHQQDYLHLPEDAITL